jgi:hypothetical protein
MTRKKEKILDRNQLEVLKPINRQAFREMSGWRVGDREALFVRIRCPHCGKDIDKEQFRQHQNEHQKVGNPIQSLREYRVKCPLCETHTTPGALKSHLMQAHSSGSAWSVPVKIPTVPQGETSQNSFKRPVILKKAQNKPTRKSRPNPIGCPICLSLVKAGKIADHLKNVHGLKDGSILPSHVQCPLCSYSLSLQDFRHHLLNVHQMKNNPIQITETPAGQQEIVLSKYARCQHCHRVAPLSGSKPYQSQSPTQQTCKSHDFRHITVCILKKD